MRYEFSFERRQAYWLAALVCVVAILLVGIGFLAGELVEVPRMTPPDLTKPKLPAIPKAKDLGDLAGPSALADPADKPPAPGATDKPADASAAEKKADASAADKPAADKKADDPGAAVAGSGATPADLKGKYALQYGSFSDPAAAKAALTKLGDLGVKPTAAVFPDWLGAPRTVLRAGSYTDLSAASTEASAQTSRLGVPVLIRPAGSL